jgi:hypothetical protein
MFQSFGRFLVRRYSGPFGADDDRDEEEEEQRAVQRYAVGGSI